LDLKYCDNLKPVKSIYFIYLYCGEVYSQNNGIYAYKIIGKQGGGGVQLLTGGTRKLR
jgi:hypothetical protein